MPKKKRVVLIVLNNFLNDSRVLKEAISLQCNGYEVEVVALHEEGLKKEEVIKGIKVTRIKIISRNFSKHIIVKLIKYFEFCIHSLKKCKDADIVHCNDLNALPIGLLGKIFLSSNLKVIYDAHEFEPFLHGISPLETRLRIYLERSLLLYADRVITVSGSIAASYEMMYGIKKPELVLNCPPFREFNRGNWLREELGISKEKKIFLYQGKLSKGRGVESLIDAFSRMKESLSVIVFMGYGPLEEFVRTAAAESKQIYYHPAVGPDVLLDYTASADFGVTLTQDTCLNNRYSLPNKLFEYLMAGIPVVCSNLPEMKKVVEENKIGMVIQSDGIPQMIKSLNQATELHSTALGINIEKARQDFSWQVQERKLLAVYNAL